MNNVLQTNTFAGGMNCDVDISILPNSQYRYAENVRVVTNDGGSTGILQNIEGVKKYNVAIASNEVVIGTTTIDKYAVVFTKVVVNGIYKYNKIYRVTGFDTTTPTHSLILKGDIGLCSNSNVDNISVVSNYETDKNIKVYFTDGTTATKVLNIVDNKYVGIGPTNPLLDISGNILNPLAIDITPGSVLPPFKINDLQFGNLASGVVQYCYQLFNLHGTESAASSLSELIHLTDSVSSQSQMQYKGQAPNKNSGKSCVISAPLVSHDFQKCRIISISYSDNNAQPRIFIVDEIDLISGQQNIDYIDTGNNIIGEITVEQFNSITGYQFIGSTITKMDNRLFAANIREDSWNPVYDARAYRSTISGLLVLNSADTSKQISKQLPTDAAELKTFYDSIPNTHDCINPFNSLKSEDVNNNNAFEYSNIINNSIILKGGSGVNIDYTFVYATVNVGNYDFTGFPLAGMTKAFSSLNDNGVGLNLNAEIIDGVSIRNPQTTVLEIKQQFKSPRNILPNYSDPILAANYKSYQRDEVYRFGIVFYNKKNIASPVHWIGDIRMPHASDNDYIPFYPNVGQITGRPLGIKFNVRNLPAECTAYEIVRCDRTESDRSILMQGIMSITANSPHGDEEGGLGGEADTRPYIWPTYSAGPLTTRGWWELKPLEGSHTSILPQNYIKDNYITFMSPEVSLQGDSIEKLFKNVTYLESVYGLASPFGDVKSYGEGNVLFNVHKLLGNASKVSRTDGNGESAINDSIGSWTAQPGTGGIDVTPFTMSEGELTPIGLISKLYVPFSISATRTDSSTGLPVNTVIGKHSSAIQAVKFPKLIPYNALPDKSAYYNIIGDINYLNLAQTEWQSSIIGSGGASKFGPYGPCLIIQSDNVRSNISAIHKVQSAYGDINWAKESDQNKEFAQYNNTATIVSNIKKHANPYGGNTFSSRQNSIYISTGSYNKDSAINYVFGGDTFLNILDQAVTTVMQKKDPTEHDNYKVFVGAYVPLESSVNLALQYGDSVHRTWRKSDNYLGVYQQLNPIQLGKYHVQDAPYFVYNGTYSSQPGSKKFIPASIYTQNDIKTGNRIVCSEAKTNNEILDNWIMFKFANYLDVDNQYGSITNLKAFKDRLYFWQDTALGIASVNERSLIQDNNVGSLTLGTGGILTRADYLTTTNGSSIINDRSIVSSSNTIYWYDFDKNVICSVGSSVAELSKEKGVQTYLNELYTDKRNVTLGLYDNKYNEIWFKFYDKSLIFSEQIGQFTSFYTFNPQWQLQFSDKIITIKDNNYYILNSIDIDGIEPATKLAKVQTVINKDGYYTKVFDNVLFSGEFNDPSTTNYITAANNILFKKGIVFKTKSQEATPFYNSVDYREDSYRFAIGREKLVDATNASYAGRMKGKYLVCDYTFDCNNNRTFKLPYINTTYRYSLV